MFLAHEAFSFKYRSLGSKKLEILINVEKVRFKDVINLRGWCGYNPLGEKKTYLVRDYIGPDLEVFRDLLREDWAEFLTKDPEVNRRFWIEYRNFEELPF